MKKIWVVIEGVADQAYDVLNDRTPLQTARCATAAGIAARGQSGRIKAPGREWGAWLESYLPAMMGVSAENLEKLRRGPLLAAAFGIEPGEFAYAACGRLVTLDADRLVQSNPDHLPFAEINLLLEALNPIWQAAGFCLRALTGNQFLILGREFLEGGEGSAPEGRMGEMLKKRSIYRKKGDRFQELLDASRECLAGHPINEVRIDLGEDPVNGLWIWGGGRLLGEDSVFSGQSRDLFTWTQSDSAQGWSRLAGHPVVSLIGIWGGAEGTASGLRIAEAVSGLQHRSGALLYVAAPKPGGGYGTPAEKVRALEALDQRLLAPLVEMLEAFKPYRIMVTSAGLVSTLSGILEPGPVPLMIAGEGIDPDSVDRWDEMACRDGALGLVDYKEIIK